MPELFGCLRLSKNDRLISKPLPTRKHLSLHELQVFAEAFQRLLLNSSGAVHGCDVELYQWLDEYLPKVLKVTVGCSLCA